MMPVGVTSFSGQSICMLHTVEGGSSRWEVQEPPLTQGIGQVSDHQCQMGTDFLLEVAGELRGVHSIFLREAQPACFENNENKCWDQMHLPIVLCAQVFNSG